MGSLIPPELSLDCRFSSKACVQKTTGKFLSEVSRIHSTSEKILKLDDYVNRLQDERTKIGGLKNELPLCMLLLGDAIVTMKEELTHCKESNPEPVLEFIPLEKSSNDEKDVGTKEKDISSSDKMDWLSSAQLWNPDNDHHDQNTNLSNTKSTSKLDNNKRTEEERNRLVMDNLFQSGKNRAAERTFVPFKGCTNFPVMNVAKEDRNELPVAGLSLCTPQVNNSREDINGIVFSPISSCSRSESSSATHIQANYKHGQQQNTRKQRRCWSPELHRRFVDALHKLGGAQAATPKQIRELMQVNGLTNDEVKSHLQKYRLHNRRVTTNTSRSQAIGLWMSRELFGEPLKLGNSQSGSPTGPLNLEGSCPSSADSIEDEDEDNETDSNC